jgi:ribonuclease HI
MIYTDGSKSFQGVGIGFCSIINQRIIKRSKFKLSSYCSVFQAELFATLQALKHIKDNYNKTTKICICTDSSIDINALQETRSTNQLIQRIMKEVVRVEGQCKNCHFVELGLIMDMKEMKPQTAWPRPELLLIDLLIIISSQ